MTRQEFMTRLERLLWNVPESDRLDAIAYYNDYFEEAGPENEAKVLQELGSPEKVAATIKGEMFEGMYTSKESSYGEYTERGYSDRASRRKSTEAWQATLNKNSEYKDSEYKKKEHKGNGYKESGYQSYDENSANTSVSVWKKDVSWPIVVLLLIIASPILLGIAGGLFGGLMGLIGAAIGVLAGTSLGGGGLLIGGTVCMVVGIVRVFAVPLEGLTLIAVGAFLAAIGLLFVVLFVWMVGKWIPNIVRGLINGCRKVYSYVKRRFGV